MWVLDHLADLESDFAVFHRIEDPLDHLSGPEFFRKAHRLAAYSGVMAARVVAASKDSPPASGGYRAGTGAGSGEPVREVPLAEVIALHPDLIERG